MHSNDVTILWIRLSSYDENQKDFTFIDAQKLLFACDYLVGKYPTQVNEFLSNSDKSLLQLIVGNDGYLQYELKEYLNERYGVIIP